MTLQDMALGISGAAAVAQQRAPLSEAAPLQTSRGAGPNSNPLASPNSLLFLPGTKQQVLSQPQILSSILSFSRLVYFVVTK